MSVYTFPLSSVQPNFQSDYESWPDQLDLQLENSSFGGPLSTILYSYNFTDTDFQITLIDGVTLTDPELAELTTVINNFIAVEEFPFNTITIVNSGNFILQDQNQTLTPALIANQNLIITPYYSRTFTIPHDFVRQFGNPVYNTAIPFNIINLSPVNPIIVTIESSSRNNLSYGWNVVRANHSKQFWIQITDLTYDNETFTLYCL